MELGHALESGGANPCSPVQPRLASNSRFSHILFMPNPISVSGSQGLADTFTSQLSPEDTVLALLSLPTQLCALAVQHGAGERRGQSFGWRMNLTV